MPKKIVAIALRLPAGMHNAARRVADIERRSLNSQLLIWIERGMPAGLLDETRADIAEAVEPKA